MLTPSEVEILKLKIEIREALTKVLDLSTNAEELKEIALYLESKL